MDDTEFLVDDYDSDDNAKGSRKAKDSGDYGNVSKEVLELLKRYANHHWSDCILGRNQRIQKY